MNSLKDGDPLLTYIGFFSAHVLDDILESVETRLMNLGEKDGLRKRVFSICTEMLQNLFHRHDLRWNPKWKTEYETVIFRLDKSASGYQVSVGNFVDTATKLNLVAKIDEVNSLGKDGIKEKYREVLQTSEFTPKGGAGLGIIDLARRSHEKLRYKILPCNEDYCFFCILAKVII